MPDGPTVLGGYRRCADFDREDRDGQDFAGIEASDDGVATMIVVDGVSRSFLPALAARMVAEALLDDLRDITPGDHAAFRDAVRAALGDGLRSKVREVESRWYGGDEVHADFGDIESDAREVGSEVVLVATRFDTGRRVGSAALIGDATLSTMRGVVVEDHTASASSRAAATRWSSLAAMPGDAIRYVDLNSVDSLLLASDGFIGGTTASYDISRFPLADDARLAEDLERSAKLDDASFIFLALPRAPRLADAGDGAQELLRGAVEAREGDPPPAPSEHARVVPLSDATWTSLGTGSTRALSAGERSPEKHEFFAPRAAAPPPRPSGHAKTSRRDTPEPTPQGRPPHPSPDNTQGQDLDRLAEWTVTVMRRWFPSAVAVVVAALLVVLFYEGSCSKTFIPQTTTKRRPQSAHHGQEGH